MSDPRFNRYGMRTNWHKPVVQMDSPLFYGWTATGQSELGHTIFELGPAKLRSTGPEDNCPYAWLVFIGDDVYGYNGTLAEITADVQQAIVVPA